MKPIVGWEVFEKKKKTLKFFTYKYSWHMLSNRKQFIIPQKKYFKSLKGMIMALHVHNLFSHLQFFKVGKIMAWMKFGDLILSGTFTDSLNPDTDFTYKVEFNLVYNL